MTQTTATRKARAAQKQCICCGHKLSPTIKHAVTPLGPLGPDCAKKADIAAALERLDAYDLGALVGGGEIRLNGVSSADGCFRFPEAEFEALKAQASACGVRLAWRSDFAARQFVVTLKAESVGGLLARLSRTC